MTLPAPPAERLDPARPGSPGRAGVRRPRPGWTAAAAAIALVLTGLVTVGPLVAIGVLAVLLLLLLAVCRPKTFAALALVTIMLGTPLRNLLGPAGHYTDEGVIALAVLAFSARRLVTEGRLVWLPGSGWFLGFLAAGGLSAYLAQVPAATAVPAAYIAVKGVVLAFALAQLRWTEHDLVVLVRLGIAAIVTVTVTGVINLVAPRPWAELLTGSPPIGFLGPVPAINGIFQHPAAFSRFCGVLAIGCLVYGFVVRRSVANLVLVALTGGLAFLTFQVKSILGLLATLAAMGLRFLRPIGAAAVVCLGPLIAVLSAPPLALLVGTDLRTYFQQDSARARLLEGGVAVAQQYFPFGAGFGRYGSAMAAETYSPLYYALGFSDRYGLAPSPGPGQFLNDNQWPAIMGEAGWFGAICFAAGLACMLVSLLRRVPGEGALVRWLRVSGVGWLILLVVESTASPVFVSSPSFPFVFAAAGVVASFRVSARDTARSHAGRHAPGPTAWRAAARGDGRRG